MVTTVSGKDVSVSVGYRLPLPLYEEAERWARDRGVKLSVILREATEFGLAVLAGGDGGDIRRIEAEVAALTDEQLYRITAGEDPLSVLTEINMAALTDEQLYRITAGENPLSVLINRTVQNRERHSPATVIVGDDGGDIRQQNEA